MTDTDARTGPGEGDDGGDVGSPPSPWWRRWWVWPAAAVVVLVAVGVLIWAVQDDDEAEDAAPTTTSAPTTTTTTRTSTTTTTTTTSTPPPALTLETLSQQIVTLVPANLSDPAYECRTETTGPLTVGSVATCQQSPLPIEGETHTVTVLVLDDAGTYAATRSGNDHLLLNSEMIVQREPGDPPLSAGLNCTNLLAPDSPFTQEAKADELTPEQTYFGVVLYYFLQDRSPLMDIDNNGIPCETLIESSVVDTVWAGGWIASRWD